MQISFIKRGNDAGIPANLWLSTVSKEHGVFCFGAGVVKFQDGVSVNGTRGDAFHHKG